MVLFLQSFRTRVHKAGSITKTTWSRSVHSSTLLGSLDSGCKWSLTKNQSREGFFLTPRCDRIQEIVINVDVVLVCGSSTLTWLRFTTALNILSATSPGSSEHVGLNKLHNLQSIVKMWGARLATTTSGLLPFPKQHDRRKCRYRKHCAFGNPS